MRVWAVGIALGTALVTGCTPRPDPEITADVLGGQDSSFTPLDTPLTAPLERDATAFEPDTALDERTVAQRVKDASLAAQVTVAFAEDTALRRFDLEAEVQRGLAQLAGTVETAQQRVRAGDVAGGVSGVREVVNLVLARADTAAVAATPAPFAVTAGLPLHPARRPAPAAEEAPTHHTVRNGESLWTISQEHDVTIDRLRQLNNLRSNAIRPGQRLRLR